MKTSIDQSDVSSFPSRCATHSGSAQGRRLDISRYGAGLQLLPAGRTARLVDEAGLLVATGDTAIDDVFGLVDTGRR